LALFVFFFICVNVTSQIKKEPFNIGEKIRLRSNVLKEDRDIQETHFTYVHRAIYEGLEFIFLTEKD